MQLPTFIFHQASIQNPSKVFFSLPQCVFKAGQTLDISITSMFCLYSEPPFEHYRHDTIPQQCCVIKPTTWWKLINVSNKIRNICIEVVLRGHFKLKALLIPRYPDIFHSLLLTKKEAYGGLQLFTALLDFSRLLPAATVDKWSKAGITLFNLHYLCSSLHLPKLQGKLHLWDRLLIFPLPPSL